jgi:heme/copper-type cytochrome/quinol oxidase subunit 2
MNEVLGTILAGIVVTVIGALAAYYFGVRQERLRQAYERENEERTRLEHL